MASQKKFIKKTIDKQKNENWNKAEHFDKEKRLAEH